MGEGVHDNLYCDYAEPENVHKLALSNQLGYIQGKTFWSCNIHVGSWIKTWGYSSLSSTVEQRYCQQRMNKLT